MIHTQHIGILVQVKISKSDPTRTLTLRNAFERQMVVRFVRIIRSIKQAIVTDDCFGLNPTTVYASPGKGKYRFHSTSDKIDEFMRWLNSQVGQELLIIGRAPQYGQALQAPWTNMYIADSYQRGIQRGRYELAKAGYSVPTLEQTGEMAASMSTPFHMDRVGILYTQTFNDLKGITNAMDNQISRVLSQAMIEGDGANKIARKLVAVIKGGGGELGITDTLGRFIPAERRARMLARTEIIRAHHQATIQEYRNWGAVGVKVQAEWQTAGDERVCDECGALEGQVFTLDEIEPMIPVHPMCRCMALPMEVKKVAKLTKSE